MAKEVKIVLIQHDAILVDAVKRDIKAIASIYPSAFNLYDEPLDRLATRVISTVLKHQGKVK